MSDKKIMGLVALKNRYDAHFNRVLGGNFIQQVSRQKKGERASFQVLKPLPTSSEYEQLRNRAFTVRLDSLVDFSEIENLAGEMRDWYDNLPPGLQGADKGSEVDECASGLENISAVDVPDFITGMTVFHPPALDVNSRSDRLYEVKGCLDAVVQALDIVIDQKKFVFKDEDTGIIQIGFRELDEEQLEELRNFRSELDNVSGELEGISFPGMY
jgi:hypothetical protein